MLLDLLIILTFIVEASFLLYMEMKIWRTLYTPLLFLLLPYTLVLFITMMVSGQMGFVELYYPSILIWCYGLALFAVPSFVIGYCYSRSLPSKIELPSNDNKVPALFVAMAVILFLLFVAHFRSVAGSMVDFIGSEDFSDNFSGHGLWAHLHVITLPLVVLFIYWVDKKRWWMWLIIVALMLVSVINQVKGWIIIPLVAGLSMRLYFKKTKLKLSLVINMLLFGFIVFLVSYAVLPLLGKGEGEMTGELFEFVFGHFFHYLTSGILGMSVDLQNGCPDSSSIEHLIAPVINVVKLLTGDKDMLTPVNDLYYNTGINLTNVRTFFGTAYIYTEWYSFPIYIMLVSSIMYSIFVCARRFQNVYICTIYFFECALLCMGWFEFYLFHLTAFEFPVWALVLMGMVNIQRRFSGKPFGSSCISCTDNGKSE